MTAKNRPISPHLQVYRPQITSVTSILHRITGLGLALGTLLLAWWLIAAATGDAAFAAASAALPSAFPCMHVIPKTHHLRGRGHPGDQH